MKKIMLIFLILATDFFADVYVNGYTKQNGTYIAPHFRSDPNDTKCDNWSTKGNVNPYTGEIGNNNYSECIGCINNNLTKQNNQYNPSEEIISIKTYRIISQEIELINDTTNHNELDNVYDMILTYKQTCLDIDNMLFNYLIYKLLVKVWKNNWYFKISPDGIYQYDIPLSIQLRKYNTIINHASRILKTCEEKNYNKCLWYKELYELNVLRELYFSNEMIVSFEIRDKITMDYYFKWKNCK